MEEISKLREKIDTLDTGILVLLSDRLKYSEKIGKIKKENQIEISHSNRENEILSKLKEYNLLKNDEIDEIWNLIFTLSKNRQKVLLN
jgi:chorismate mutase